MASEFDLPIAGQVQIEGAPKEFENAPAIPLQTENTREAIPTSEFDLPVVNAKEEKTPFKYQEDPTIQRIKGTPQERKTVDYGVAEGKEIPFKDLYTNPENLTVIRDYAEARFGKEGKQLPKESDEDYAKRFMTSMRQVQWNTSLNAVPELNWLNNAKPDEVLKAARAHNLFDAVPDWYSSGGQPGIRPFAESFLSTVSEPTNILSAGVGAGARYAVARQAIKNVLSSKLKTIGAAAGAEVVIGAGQNVIEQDVARKTGVQRDEMDYTQLAIQSAISAFGGGFEAAAAVKGKITTTKKQLEDILEGKRSKTVTVDPATKQLNELFNKSQDDLLKEFDIFEGRKILDDLSAPTDLTQSQIRKDINLKAIDAAKYVMLLAPELRPVNGQKVSDAVRNIFMSMDNIDNDVIDAALKKADLTPEDFANAARTTVADAASVMQGYSALARTLKKVAQLDPEAEKLVNELYGKDFEAPSIMGNALRAINRLERESKAIVVSGLGTTIRNVLGTTGAMTMDAASNLIDNAIYTTGKAITGMATGTYQKGDISKGLKDTVQDAFATLGYMRNAGLTAETVDAILKNNPRLQNQLFSALQESTTSDLSKVARTVNTLNVAQDAFFRRAIFASSVQRQLNRVGIDMMDLLANNKDIPVDILKNATDETLKATFSYMPKQKKAADKSVEAVAEGLAHDFVNIFEKIPGGSLVVTFPRFMSNAIAFQYRYSPLGTASGAVDMASGAARIAKGEDGGYALLNQGLEKTSKGVVGTAAIYAAYKYRMENQDEEWYNVKNADGSTTDMRALFPMGPYLAVGDFIAKQKTGRPEDAKLSELASTIAGMKMPAGTQSYLLDQLPQYIAGSEGKDADKVSVALGRLLGDFMGRFTTPGKPVFEYLDLFDAEGQIARDPNVITSDDKFQQAAVQRVMAKLPELKEDLPEFQPYFSNKAPVRAGEFFNTLTGMRLVPSKPLVEKEFVKLNLDPYAIFGSTGDKVYDRAFIKESVPMVEKRMTDLIESDRYKGYTLDQKRLAAITTMQETLGISREMTQAKMTVSDRDRVNQLRFNKLPAVARRAINELYAAEHDGKSMDATKDYGQVYKYEAIIQRYR